jgi:RsiW-degrading membrane proteinase PrsW (M82 family)/predicted RNA-binding Zn-ribbon protein involved in translation (DUF1610 family)
VNCSCGLNYDLTISPAGCPKCGKGYGAASAPAAAVETKLRFPCPSCGLVLTSTSRLSGQSMTCLACGKPAAVPTPEAAAGSAQAAATARRTSAATVARKPPARPDGWRSVARWALLLALIPLGLYTFLAQDDLKSRTEETRRQNPDVSRKFAGEMISEEELELIPSHRIEGAAFARTTSVHWVIAILSALVFWEFILIVQPMGTSTSKQLWAVGVFTGTIGILLLLIIQVIAIVSMRVGGFGCAFLPIVILLKLIGFSYWAALNPNNGFVLSMLGFTFGVGLMEEFFKALPLYWHYRRSATLDVRGAVVWGLATGIGFGVSEGISYCSSYYNGLSGGGVYVVRFVSCVALHAVWSATAAILIWKRQESLQSLERWYHWLGPIFATLWISMLLHAFYDTCLKKEHGVASLVCALISFALFFFLYDRACRQEHEQRAAPALA